MQRIGMNPIMYQGVPCFTTQMLADTYGVSYNVMAKRFSRCKDVMMQNEHFFILHHDEIKRLDVLKAKSKAVLFTERGATILGHKIDHKKAKTAFKVLESSVHTMKEVLKPEKPTSPTITSEQQATLQSIVKTIARENNEPYQRIWGRFNHHFKLACYNQLPQKRFAEAVSFLQPAPAPRSVKPLPISQEQAKILPSHDRELRDLFDRYQDLIDEFSVQMRRFSSEYRRIINDMAKEATRRVFNGSPSMGSNMFLHTLCRDAYDLETMGNKAQEKFDFTRRLTSSLNHSLCM